MCTFIHNNTTSILIKMHPNTLYRVINPHQRCIDLHATDKNRNETKQVMPKSEDLIRSLEINNVDI